MRKLFLLVLVLMLCSVCFGTDYYVATTGTDDLAAGRGETVGDPWATVDYAIETGTPIGTHTINVATGTYDTDAQLRINTGANNKTLTILGVAGTILEYSDASTVYFANALTAVDLTFQDITFHRTPGSTCYGNRIDAACVAVDLTFIDCIWTNGAGVTNARLFTVNTASGATTRNITVSGGNFTGKGETTTGLMYDCGNVTINGLTLTQPGATGHVFNFGYTQKNIQVSNCNITSSSSGYACFLNYQATTLISACTSVDFSGNTIVGGSGLIMIGVSGVTYPVYIYNNNHTDMHTYGYFIGANTNENIDDIGYVYVDNNTVVKVGSNAGHGMLIGKGVVAGQISDNLVDVSSRSAEYAIVSKADNAVFSNNIAIGDHGLTVKGSQNATYVNNTARGTGDEALFLLNDPAASPNPEKATFGCLIKNNIFDGGTSDNAVNISSDTELYDYVFESNNYYGGTNLFVIATVNKTFAEAETWWEANGSYNIQQDNMNNGMNVDPQLDSNYEAKNSTLIEAGIGVPVYGSGSGSSSIFGTGSIFGN